jgi:hypothetical protein
MHVHMNTHCLGHSPKKEPTKIWANSNISCRLFCFLDFFEKNLTNTPFLERFQKMDLDLGAMDCSAEITRLGALDLGAEMVQFLVSVCERVLRGQGLGALVGDSPRGPL